MASFARRGSDVVGLRLLADVPRGLRASGVNSGRCAFPPGGLVRHSREGKGIDTLSS